MLSTVMIEAIACFLISNFRRYSLKKNSYLIIFLCIGTIFSDFELSMASAYEITKLYMYSELLRNY